MKAKYIAVLVTSIFLIIIIGIGNKINAHPPPDIPPVASLWANPVHVPPGVNVELNGSGSYDSDGKIVECAWDVDGDETWDYTEVCPAGDCTKIVEHAYESEGTYTAKLRVKDDDGAYGYDTDPVYVYECYWCALGLGPETVRVTFMGIQRCCDPPCDNTQAPNGEYTLDKTSNCKWEYWDEFPDYTLWIEWEPFFGLAPLGGTKLIALDSTGSNPWFIYESDVPCEVGPLDNDQQSCDPQACVCGYQGTGEVIVVWPTP